ncbi:MAG: hypothetical protein IKL24_01840 [Clostridia bacterium]|nr:hypothetical protein [Clostridia bacterium]
MKLITNVKNGKNEDFDVIRSMYDPLIKDMAKSFEDSGSGSPEDLLDEAERALLKAVLSFDTEKEGITFGLYAKICIRNALISVRRANAARKKKQSKAKREQNVKFRFSVAGGLGAAEMLTKIEKSLSPYEAQVLREFFDSKSASEVALSLGTSEKSVYNAVFRIRRKAKELSAEHRNDHE